MSALWPWCRECDAERGIDTAVVTLPNPDGVHTVLEYDLECGHTIDDPSAQIDAGVVDLIQETRPDAIEFATTGVLA